MAMLRTMHKSSPGSGTMDLLKSLVRFALPSGAAFNHSLDALDGRPAPRQRGTAGTYRKHLDQQEPLPTPAPAQCVFSCGMQRS